MKKNINMCICFWVIFQQLKIYIYMLKKRSINDWATAQLCHNTMGHCIVTQQVLGGLLAMKLYCKTMKLYCNLGQLVAENSVAIQGIVL